MTDSAGEPAALYPVNTEAISRLQQEVIAINEMLERGDHSPEARITLMGKRKGLQLAISYALEDCR